MTALWANYQTRRVFVTRGDQTDYASRVISTVTNSLELDGPA